MKPMRDLIGATVVVVVLLAGCSASATAKRDVTITACTPDPTGGHPTATGRIVNHSSKSSVYTIHVKFTDSAGNRVGDGLAAVAKVDPGTAAKWHATGSVDAKGPLKCTLASVTRNAVP
jgi:tripartite-type tricarboxylate transporter receptor subunit TctC